MRRPRVFGQEFSCLLSLISLPIKYSRFCGALLLVCSFSHAQTPELLISGANEELTANIQAHARLSGLACDAPQSRVANLLPRIRQQVVRASRALGYYQLRHRVRGGRQDDCWQITIEVEPGPPVMVENVSIDIDENASFFRSVIEQPPLQSGQQLNQANYERIKGQLNALAVEQGFFDARLVNSELQLDLVSNTANAQIKFSPGERYRFGAFRIQGHEILGAEFINRYIDVDSGEFFSSSALLQIRQSLTESLYFNNVTISPQHEQAVGQEIPLAVNLSMRARRAFTLGGGATTDIGPRVRADFENRYLNAVGHRFSVNSSVSPVQQQLDFGYEIPLANPRTQRLEFSLGVLGEDVDAFDTRTDKLGSKYTFIDSHGWRRDYMLSFQHDEYRLHDEQRESSDLLIPGISFTRTQADDTLYPNRGWRLFAELKGAHNALISTETFLQLNVVGKVIETIGPGRVLLKMEAGTTLVDDILDLPVSLQYFTGGDQSVRGYKYQSLGPINDQGEVVGGKHLLSTGIEYDFGILPNWKMAVFADAGNSFNDFSDFQFKKSAGVGIRWMSPIGPIRLDVARALDDDNKFRLHLTMGPDL